MISYQKWMLEKGLAPSTIKIYISIMKEFENWWKEKTDDITFNVHNVTAIDLQDYKNDLNTKLKPTTLNKKIEGIRSYFKYCVDSYIIKVNPAEKLKTKKIENRYESPRWLNRNEKNRLLRLFHKEHMKTKNSWRFIRNKAIVNLMLYAGLRVSEVVDLEIKNINFIQKVIEINNGKGGKFRRIEIEREIIEVLHEWLKIRKNKETDKIFTSQKKGALTSNAIQRIFTRLSIKADIKGLTPHVLRHTFCHDLAEKGFSLSLIAALAGHSDLNTTRIYTVPGNIERRKAIQALSL